MGINAMVRCPSCNNIIRKMRLKFDGLCPICSENKQLKWELKELPRKIREVERLKGVIGSAILRYWADGTKEDMFKVLEGK